VPNKLAGFSGTREGMSTAQYLTLLQVLRQVTVLHHGGYRGADTQTHWLFRHLHGRPGPTDGGRIIVVHPAIMGAYTPAQRLLEDADVVKEPRPPLERDRAIVDAVAWLSIAPLWPRDHSRSRRSGTWHTARYALDQGKPVLEITRGGETHWLTNGGRRRPAGRSRLEAPGTAGPPQP
jgi:hypothetical protein